MMRRCIPLLALVLSFGLVSSVVAATTKTSSTIKKSSSSKTSSSKKSSSSVVAKKPEAEVFAVDPSGKAPQVRCASAILLDARTGEVLLEVNPDQHRPVASTQKLLTGLLVAEAGDLGEPVKVKTSDTLAEPSKLYIKEGDVYERQKLLQVLLVKSMNDVARCLARDNAGSLEAFADKMNARARQLGMDQSNFVNPNGLPAAGQYSTARDMSKLAMAAYRNRVIRNIVSMKSLTWKYNTGRVTTFTTTNRVLKNFALCNGMKTGYTEASGHCLISSASNGTRDVIAVVLGGNRETIWVDSYRLLAWGLSS